MNFSTGGKRANTAAALTPRKEKAQLANGDRLGFKGFDWIGETQADGGPVAIEAARV